MCGVYLKLQKTGDGQIMGQDIWLVDLCKTMKLAHASNTGSQWEYRIFNATTILALKNTQSAKVNYHSYIIISS